jgi:hypothetical protein
MIFQKFQTKKRKMIIISLEKSSKIKIKKEVLEGLERSIL